MRNVEKELTCYACGAPVELFIWSHRDSGVEARCSNGECAVSSFSRAASRRFADVVAAARFITDVWNARAAGASVPEVENREIVFQGRRLTLACAGNGNYWKARIDNGDPERDMYWVFTEDQEEK